MTTQPGTPPTDPAKAARIHLVTALIGSVIGIIFMFNTLPTNAAIIGTAALITADVFVYFALQRARNKPRK